MFSKGFPVSYDAIRRMARKIVLQVPMARAIVRRAGVRASAEVAASALGAPILSIPGTGARESFCGGPALWVCGQKLRGYV